MKPNARELQAIREGDFKLAQAAHQDKLAWINAANSEMRAQSEAKYKAQAGQYQAGLTAVGLADAEKRAAVAQDVKQAELNQNVNLANARNQTAISAAGISASRGANAGDQVCVNAKVVQDARKEAQAKITQLEALNKSGELRKDRAAWVLYNQIKTDPGKFINDYVRKAIQAPGVTYSKREMDTVYGGVGNQDIDLSQE